MDSDKTIILNKMSEAVYLMDSDLTAKMSREYIDSGYPITDGIMNGLMMGMNRAAESYKNGEYFLTELFFCADALNEGLDILKPELKKMKIESAEEKHRVVIGVVSGDIHDIGKNLVATMLETAGFEVKDLGVEVPAEKFVEVAEEFGAEIIAMSTFLSTTMDEIEKVIELLKERDLREKYIVMIGGSATSQAFADEIGADIFTEDAVEASRAARKAVGLL